MGTRRDPQTRTTVQKRSYAWCLEGLDSSSKVPAFIKVSFNQEGVPGQKHTRGPCIPVPICTGARRGLPVTGMLTCGLPGEQGVSVIFPPVVTDGPLRKRVVVGKEGQLA